MPTPVPEHAQRQHVPGVCASSCAIDAVTRILWW
jgi:hypothetical protein